MRVLNYVLILLIFLLAGGAAYWFFRKKGVLEHVGEDVAVNAWDLEHLAKEVKQSIDNILRSRPEELNLNEYETEKRIQQRGKLRRAIRECSLGDAGSKIYIKDYILDLLQTKYSVDADSVDQVLPFASDQELSIEVRFQILLHQYAKKHKNAALEALILEYGLDAPTGGTYEITEQDIERIYRSKRGDLEYSDKLQIICQEIYQKVYGHGAADQLLDMKLEGVSAGVSGVPEEMFNYTDTIQNFHAEKQEFSYNAIWIMFQGKTIHLSFLGFGSQKELIRVCNNIYRYNSPGQLSQSRGYIINDMRNGGRVSVARPPFSDSWIFLVRNHLTGKLLQVREQLTDTNANLAVGLLEFLVKGCQVLAVTGQQGCGKTTLLRGLIEFLDPNYNIRIQEQIFELNLRKVYPGRDIATFKETSSISGQEGLNFQKKTDGAVNILGEVAEEGVARWIVQIAQAASRMTMFTHHAITTDNLVRWMRNALLKEGGFQSETVATEEVVHTVNFDVHMEAMLINGKEHHRYIERITEIVPIEKNGTDTVYQAVDVLVFDREKMAYRMQSRLSRNCEDKICKYLNAEQQKRFLGLFAGVDAEAEPAGGGGL